MPEWATSANYNAGPLNGQATRVEPTSGEKANGWWLNQKPPVRKFNWLLGLLCDWAKHLDESRVTALSAHFTVETSATGAWQNLTVVTADTGITVSGGNRARLPVGKYAVTWKAKMLTSSTGSNPTVSLDLTVNSGGSAVTYAASETRPGSTATVYVNCGDTVHIEVVDSDADLVGLTVSASDGTPSLSAAGRLTIVRLNA